MPCLCLNCALFVPFLILHCAVAPKPCLSLKSEFVHMHGVTLVYTSSMHQASKLPSASIKQYYLSYNTGLPKDLPCVYLHFCIWFWQTGVIWLSQKPKINKLNYKSACQYLGVKYEIHLNLKFWQNTTLIQSITQSVN